MRLLKKVLAVTAALTLLFAAVPASAATGKALFIDKQDGGMIAKVLISAIDLVGASNLDQIRAITLDVTVASPDGSKLEAWNGGGIGAKIGEDGLVWYQGGSWEASDAENSTATVTFKETFVDGMGFTKDATGGAYLFMNWSGNLNDFYIDNVQLLDADGNALTLANGSTVVDFEDGDFSAFSMLLTDGDSDQSLISVEDFGATDAATDAATTDTKASDAPKTGSTSFALYFIAGAAVMLTGTVVLKRRKTIAE
jgi:LPXTG-motif cell wall-anchored protein